MLCTTTARGDLLAGTTPQVQTTARGTNTAITLTLDANIQRACEAIAAQNMSKGCIIVMQVGSGQILASTSMPEFDPDDIAASIRADDTSSLTAVCPLSARVLCSRWCWLRRPMPRG